MSGNRTLELEVAVEVDEIVRQMLNGELPVAEVTAEPRPREVVLSEAEEPITIYNN